MERRRRPLYRIQMEDIIKLKFEQCLKHTERQRSYGGKKSVRFLNSSFFKTEQEPPKHSKARSSAHLKRVNSKWNDFYS